MIKIKKRDGSVKEVFDFDLEKELDKIMIMRYEDVEATFAKLKRGDILGFNDIHFKYVKD